MIDEGLFFGEPMKFWKELKRHADVLEVTDWINEIAELRAKVSFYESRIQQMQVFKERNIP